MKETQARVYLPHVAPEVSELIEKGFLKPHIFDWKDGVYTKEFAEKVQTLPRFELSARPLEIPPALLALPTDSEVFCRDEFGFDSVMTAGLVSFSLRKKIERQVKGFFKLSEAAEILSESCVGANGQAIPSEHFANDMREAFFSGALAFFNERLTLMNPKNEDETLIFGSYGETTTPQAINAWLESTGSPHRFPDAVGMPAPLVDAAPAPQASPEPVQAAPAAVPSETERPEARQNRRLSRLRDLGGNYVYRGNWMTDHKGKRGALARLEREERAAGRPMSDKSDIRKDLQAAAEREREGRPLAD